MGDFATAWLLETVASAGEALAEAGGAVGETIETVARRASVTLLGEGDGDGKPRARVVVVVDDDAIARCRPAAPSRGTCKASA